MSPYFLHFACTVKEEEEELRKTVHDLHDHNENLFQRIVSSARDLTNARLKEFALSQPTHVQQDFRTLGSYSLGFPAHIYLYSELWLTFAS